MSMAWEVASDDVEMILNRHGVQVSDDEFDEIMDSIDEDRIEEAVMYYVNMEAQTNAALSEIEDILMENDIIKGDKMFEKPSDEDNYLEDDESDEE